MTEDAAVANIYIEIINNETLMHQTFMGLFACARIYLGHKPNCHRYLFNTQTFSHRSYTKEKVAEAEKQGNIVVPFAGKESKDYFVFSCKSMRDDEMNIVYQGALDSLASKDFTNEKLVELQNKFNHHKFAKMMVEMFWLDMVTFAKYHSNYSKSWRE